MHTHLHNAQSLLYCYYSSHYCICLVISCTYIKSLVCQRVCGLESYHVGFYRTTAFNHKVWCFFRQLLTDKLSNFLRSKSRPAPCRLFKRRVTPGYLRPRALAPVMPLGPFITSLWRSSARSSLSFYPLIGNSRVTNSHICSSIGERG